MILLADDSEWDFGGERYSEMSKIVARHENSAPSVGERISVSGCDYCLQLFI